MLLPKLLLLIISSVLVTVGASPTRQQPHWVIVFDAGSTKTRMNMYQLQMQASTTKWIPIRSESKTWSTALSQFDPTKAEDVALIYDGFAELFQYAETIITNSQDQTDTPVFLYATAGLRGLPLETANRLLSVSRIAIDRSKFDHRFKKSEMTRVQMINGTQEGQFAWLSVNYIISRNIDSQRATGDVGIIDMGGGSTQIAFRPENYDVLEDAHIARSSLWYPGSGNGTAGGPGVFSKSFKDYGFSSTAMKYVGAYDDCRPHVKCPPGKSYSSVCLNPNYKSTFKFGPYVFPISGKPLSNPNKRFRLCLRKARQIIRKYGVLPGNKMKAIRVLLRHDNSLFFGVAGYYYLVKNIATRTKVPVESADREDEGPTRCQGYDIVLRQFREGARQLCKTVPNTDDPFLPYVCIRATYVTVLLQEAYRFNRRSSFHMCKYMPASEGSSKQIEIGWPLGVAQQAAEKVLEKHFNSV